MTIESQVKVLESIVAKIDTSIEKISDVSNSIGKLLAVHDSRIDNLEKVYDRTDDELREVHSRITTSYREVVDKLGEVENMLEVKLREAGDNSLRQHKEIQAGIESKITALVTRVDGLEKWRWLIVGGAITLGFLANILLKIS